MKGLDLKNKILNEIKSSKIQSEAVADAYFKKAFFNSSFKKLYFQFKTLELEKTKLEYLGKSTSKIEKDIQVVKKEIESILKNLNLTVKDFEPNYSCKICQDTGIVGDKYCQCFYKKYNEELINNIGVKINRTHTFENSNFDLFDNKDKVKKLYLKLSNWCENIKVSKTKTFILSGNTGVGKTYLLESICNKLVNKNMIINYYTSFSLNDLFYKYHTSFSENRVGLLDDVLNCDVLIIDDFGSEPKLKTSEEYFYSLFNERLIKNLTTIISTNLNPLQIMDKYGERTFSRLNNKTSSVLIKIENADLRLKK